MRSEAKSFLKLVFRSRFEFRAFAVDKVGRERLLGSKMMTL